MWRAILPSTCLSTGYNAYVIYDQTRIWVSGHLVILRHYQASLNSSLLFCVTGLNWVYILLPGVIPIITSIVRLSVACYASSSCVSCFRCPPMTLSILLTRQL